MLSDHVLKNLDLMSKKIKKRILQIDKLLSSVDNLSPEDVYTYSNAITVLSKEYRGIMESIINIKTR